MADDKLISYSYQIHGASAESGSTEIDKLTSTDTVTELYALRPCEELVVPNGSMMLVSKFSAHRLSVTRDVSIALAHCREFKPLDEHARFLVDYMPELGGNSADVERVLAAVADTGLLMPASELQRKLTHSSRQAAELAPSRAFIITCDRPAALERLLDSMLAEASLAVHEALFVIDDSRDSANAQKNRRAVESFNQSSPVTMYYVGTEQQRRLLDALVAGFPDTEDGLRFLLDRQRWVDTPSYGLSRNYCLLLSVGKRCLVMDDDVLCAAIAPPGQRSDPLLGQQMCEAEFFENAQQALQFGTRENFDPLSGHRRCLGMSVAEAITEYGAAADASSLLGATEVSMFERVSGDSPILATKCGTLGDHGSPDNSWIANLTATSRRHLTQHKGGLSAVLGNRQCWLGRSRPTFTTRLLMSQVTGLDNSQLMPPYFPVFRGEDLLFGAMLNTLHPNAVVLEYNWSVRHLPIEPRRDNPNGDAAVARGSLELLAEYLDDTAPIDSESPVDIRLRTLCLRLESLAASSDTAILSQIRTQLATEHAGTLGLLARQLRDADTDSPQWQSYLQRCVEKNLDALQSEFNVEDFAGSLKVSSAAEMCRRAREYASQYSSALSVWSAVRQAAAAIPIESFCED